MQACSTAIAWDESSFFLLAPSVRLLVCSCRETSSHTITRTDAKRDSSSETYLGWTQGVQGGTVPPQRWACTSQQQQRLPSHQCSLAMGRHEASLTVCARLPLCFPRIGASTKPQRQDNQRESEQKGRETISLTIFKCDQSCVSEGCRKIKISPYLFVHTHPLPLQKLPGSSRQLSQCNLLFYSGPLSAHVWWFRFPSWGLTIWFFLFMEKSTLIYFKKKREGSIFKTLTGKWRRRGTSEGYVWEACLPPGHCGVTKCCHCLGLCLQEHLMVLLPSLRTHFCPAKILCSKGRSGLYKTSRQGLDSAAAPLAGDCQFLELPWLYANIPGCRIERKKKEEVVKWISLGLHNFISCC